LEISLAVSNGQSMVLAIFLFQAAKVSFQRVGRFGNTTVLEVMEHVWQSGQKHAAGAFQVAEDPTRFGRTGNTMTVSFFPMVNLGQKSVPLFGGANGHYPEKEFTQAFGIGSLGVPPAPGESLPLNMHQTALKNNLGPPAMEQPVQMGVAVHRGALRSKPPAIQMGAKSPQTGRPFGYPVGTRCQLIAPRFHNREDSLAPPEAGPIQNQILRPRKIPLRWRRMRQPIPNDPADGRNAVTALGRYLSQGITFHHPALKPYPLLKTLVGRVLPAKRPTTTTAKPSLSTVITLPISFYLR